MVIKLNVMLKAHDVLGTDDEAAKQLPGKLLGLLLTLPKQVLITIIIRDASVINTPSIKKPKIVWEFFPLGQTAQAGHYHNFTHNHLLLPTLI